MTAGPPIASGRRRQRPQRQPEIPSSWAERLRALRYVGPMLRMVYQTHATYTVGILGVKLVSALVPVSQLWIGKLIIEVVEASYRGGVPIDWGHLWTLVALEFVLTAGGEALGRISGFLEGMLTEHFANHVSIRIMEHAATLDVAQFEDPDTYDNLERARQQMWKGVSFLHQVLGLLQSMITVGSLIAAVVIYVPWLFVLLVVTVLPAFFGETHFAAMGYMLRHRWTQSRRMLDYVRYVAANDEASKEVKLFGLSPYLIDRYREQADAFLRENKKLVAKRSATAAAFGVIGAVGLYAAYAVIIYYTIVGRQTAAGPFTIGVLTFLVGSFRQSRGLIQQILLGLSGLYEQSLYVRDLFLFFDLRPRVFSPPEPHPFPERIREGFVFENVTFRYPGSEKEAVRQLSFTLRPGETVALVGENGAGKTTIVKLLARLYDPDEGRVLLDGVDLREYDLDALRARIGVIFQDFLRYSFSFRDNIGVGQIEERADDRRVRDAAARSLADVVAEKLEDGFDQQLGRRFDGGVELSGGEWQKVALARAYMRDADVLILDEPTAALDARSEYEVFQRFTDLTADRLAVLISHRFSTVRMADRIIVLEAGTVKEEGTHEELLAGGGAYAELFNLQADGYR